MSLPPRSGASGISDKGEPFVVKKRERDRALMTPAESLVDSSDSTQQSDASPVLPQRTCDTGAESSSAVVELDFQVLNIVCVAYTIRHQ
ncbi:hypothetical protein HPB48_005757 [Haemaphysalis longicornis]|uniref:Uncharacterized protein n=1 Tax=Haemaphysalis longicornis TaxID=44386 RepID=A0A9J6GWF6_HAELO|nr:hypothetical protein HPB48_005757 [Haemaphysalis longicornis]